MKSDEGHPCTLTTCGGRHYDLTSLASASADYATTIGDSSYKLNVCRGVVSEVYGLDHPEDVGGFINKTQGDFSLGQVNTTLHISPATEEPMLYLQNGSPCPLNPDEYASTAIRFICSPNDFHAGKPELVAALPPLDSGNSCHFYFEWKTHVACPANRKAELEKGHYIAFGSILLIAILTWFGGVTLYNRFYLKKRGVDQFPIPKINFSSLPSVKLPGSSSNGGSQRKWGFGRRSQRGYTGLRTDEHGEDEGFASRYSLEDDDDDEEDLTGRGNEDARVLGGETNAWRGVNGPSRQNGDGGPGKVGTHQGLVDV